MLSMRPWQVQAVAFQLARESSALGGCVLGDDTGTGKTITALSTITFSALRAGASFPQDTPPPPPATHHREGSPSELALQRKQASTKPTGGDPEGQEQGANNESPKDVDMIDPKDADLIDPQDVDLIDPKDVDMIDAPDEVPAPLHNSPVGDGQGLPPGRFLSQDNNHLPSLTSASR